MNPELAALLERERAATRDAIRSAVPLHVLDHAVRAGDVVRVFPRVYAPRARVEDFRTRCLAALAYAGEQAVLSHTTALRLWECPHGDDCSVHVTVPLDLRLRATRGVTVHRRAVASLVADRVQRHGLPVTRLDRSVVDGWAVLPGHSRRAPVIASIGDRRTTVARLRGAVVPNLCGRREFGHLLDLLDAGCRSELEIWGFTEVFSGPEFAELEWQVAVRLPGRTAYLDAFSPAARVAFELDGAAWHASRDHRRRDLRRDGALSALGITVVRIDFQRMVYEPTDVRHEALAILAAHGARRGA